MRPGTGISLGLIGAYPLSVHGAVLAGRPELAQGAVALLLLAYLAWLLANGGLTRARMAMTAAVVAAIVLGMHGAWSGTLHLLYAPPIVMTLLPLLLFGRSLLPGNEPVVAWFIRVVMREDTLEVERYARRVTAVWTVFLALMLAEVIVLALVAPLWLWSLFTNVLNYLFIALLMVGEYVYRRLRYPHRAGISRMLKGLATADYGRLVRAQRRMEP